MVASNQVDVRKVLFLGRTGKGKNVREVLNRAFDPSRLLGVFPLNRDLEFSWGWFCAGVPWYGYLGITLGLYCEVILRQEELGYLGYLDVFYCCSLMGTLLLGWAVVILGRKDLVRIVRVLEEDDLELEEGSEKKRYAGRFIGFWRKL
jgi:hypothetical protein